MPEILHIRDITIEVVLKNIKHIHLTVHPPQGKVRVTAPRRMQLETIRLFALSKLQWIRKKQEAMRLQDRETIREYLNRESHCVWGKRYLLRVVERDAPATVALGHSELLLHVRAGTDQSHHRELLASWYRDQLRVAVEPLIKQWSGVLGVSVKRLFVQQMKTKWGSCNPRARTIRLNTELAKKPPEYLEYVLLHELVHLIEPSHNDRFYSILARHLPQWSSLRDQLNRTPLVHWEN